MNLLIPRRKYHSNEYDLHICPECKAPTIKKGSTIMLAAKSDTDNAQFMTNLSGSHFCNGCPVVIFDSVKVEQSALLGIRGSKNLQYYVAGMIDLDAIPKEKKHLELGTDENPIPFVDFLPDLNAKESISKENYHKYLVTKKSKKTSETVIKKAPQTKRVGRNQPCPCESGKKYKRCCGK
ncbi:MAG: SEC-C metal-binding domain-containing protein [Chitinophagales bacterium]